MRISEGTRDISSEGVGGMDSGTAFVEGWGGNIRGDGGTTFCRGIKDASEIGDGGTEF